MLKSLFPKFIIFLSCLLAFQKNYAQNEDIDLEKFAERIFQVQDDDINYEDVYESLLSFYTNKLNLNRATVAQLSSLYILTPIQINSFFDYQEKYGKLLSIYELQAIPNFDVNTIRDLLPFVTVDESSADSKPFFKRLISEENNYLLLRYTRRLEEQVGYTIAPIDTVILKDEKGDSVGFETKQPSRYVGSPDKLYGRFRVQSRDDFSLGFTVEKDNGERIAFDSLQKGFDFYSFHLLLENKLGFSKIMLGDFQLQTGQSIVFGAGFTAGRGAETVSATKRNDFGLRPYTSVIESGFFRGIGLEKSYKDFNLTLFYSRKLQDGNIQQGDSTYSNFEQFINSIQVTGFHRTPSEFLRKSQITEQNIGGILNYRPNRRFYVGISALNTNYSTPIQKKPNNYNRFEFKGNHNFLSSIYTNYTWNNFTFFGETAISKSKGIGAVAGFVTSLSKTVDMSILYRNYDRNFHSFYGNAFSKSSRNINENGTYWGISIHPNKRHKLNAYYDVFQFPWLKYLVDSPSKGSEWLARYTYKPSRHISMYAQARQLVSQQSVKEGNLSVLKERNKRNYIFNIDYDIKNKLKLKTKVQTSTQQLGKTFTSGFAIIQDVNFNIWKLKVNTRTALFDTDNFDNAQYVYESDVLYAFSIPSYNGKGIRNYIMVRFDPLRNVAIWLRYGRYAFFNRDHIGSGLEESKGNVSSDFKVMARIKF